MRAVLLLAIASAGCLRSTEFKCTDNSQCSTTGAVCEADGYCSFTDSSCASGRRYGEFAGAQSNQCVGSMGDGGMGSDGGDGGGGGCPAAYMTLPNAGTHKYSKIGNLQNWMTQRGRCAADATSSGKMVYLAIPDDAAEIQAIVTFAAAANTWVGLNDMAMDMTFVTEKGTTATFLPWLTGEPTEAGPGEDCVSALPSGQIQTDRCSEVFVAVCECEP